MYMMWFDDNTKKSIQQRVEEGAYAAEQHYRHAPTIVLISPAQVEGISLPGATVKAATYVRPNNFWFGFVAAE